MTVQEMIDILRTLDPNEEVRIDHDYLRQTVPVGDIELRGPASNIPVIIRGYE